MAAPLLRYDLLLARRSFADSFSTARDRLLLAMVAVLAVLWMRDAATRAAPSLPPGAAMMALLAGPAAYGWNAAALRRLDWFRESSVLAPQALLPRAGSSYIAFAQLPLLSILAAGVLFLGAFTGAPSRASAIAILSYGAGLALAAGAGKRAERPAATADAARRKGGTNCPGPFQALLAVQTFGGDRPVRSASLLIAGAALSTLAGCLVAAHQPAAARFAAALAPSVLLLVATARNAPDIVGLLAFAGYRAASVARFVCAIPAANLAAASIALLLVRPEGWPAMLESLLLLHLLAALVATARAWLSPGRPARRVDVQVQLEILALLIVGTLFAPLVPPVAAWRLRLIHRHYSRSLWVQG